MRRIIAIALLLACFGMQAFSQSSIQVSVQNLVSLDEQFNVTFTIEGEKAPSEFEWSEGDDFQLVWGPQKGTSTSVSIVNGKRTRSSQTTYTYVLLPKKAGKFSIPAATAVVGGNRISSRTPTVEVVANGQSSRQQSQSQGVNDAVSSGTVRGEDLYIKLILGKRNVMVGETVSATLKLYQRVNIAGFEDAKFPTFTGFWSQEVQAPTNIEFHRESIGDMIYNVAVLRSWNLVAQQAGDISIDPAELVCLVNVRVRNNSTGSIFDSFFQDDYQTIRKRVTTGPTTVHVASLPGGAPDSFHGAVGNYGMSAVLTRDSLKAHEAASLKVTVTGSGNTSLLSAPKVDFPLDFEVYDVKVSDVPGGKQFEFPFIPRSAGDFTLEPVKYSYFDIKSRKYVTLESKPLTIKVTKGAETVAEGPSGLVQGVSRRDVKDLGSDIRFISKELPRLAPAGSFLVAKPLFWILALLLIVLAAVYFFVARKLENSRADVAGSRNRAATKMARKRLSRAGAYLRDNLQTAFYEELHKTLLGFVSDKLTMDASEMSKENISARLVEKGAPDALAAEFVDLLDACEFARYAPSSGHEAMNAHFETAVKVISSIDGCMKKKNGKGGVTAALLALMLVVPGLNAHAAEKASCDSLWNASVEAYADGRWEEASALWNELAAEGLESFELYYNIGNAEFKAGNIGKAVLSYERALKLNPSDDNVRFNLEFAQSQVKDKIEAVPDFFLKGVARRVCWIMPSNAWAALSLALLALALVMVLLFLLGGSISARRTGFICGIVALLLSAVALGNALWQKNDYFAGDEAVVMSSVVSVKSSPGSGAAQDLFILHEGTKVRLLDEVGEWKNIELADGRQGWIKASDIEII